MSSSSTPEIMFYLEALRPQKNLNRGVGERRRRRRGRRKRKRRKRRRRRRRRKSEGRL